MTLEFHPLANIFPLLEGEDFTALVADIKAHGLHEPIVAHEGRILDGRNRYRACAQAGVTPAIEAYSGSDPLSYVISLNLNRRHLNESQRAMVAAKLATLKRGDNQHSPIGETSQARAAELLNVGKRSVERAADVRDRGAPELVRAVEAGHVKVSAAADIASLPAVEQCEIVARGEREILAKAKGIRARRAESRRAECFTKIAATSNASAPLPQDRKYPIVYADPPWHFEVYNELSGVARAAGNHYSTMALDEICALPVRDLATDSAVLFLWATTPHLAEAFQVITAWNFKYKGNLVWVKDRVGLGYYVRNQHEHLLIATRGDIPSPPESQRPSSVITAPRREHSRKPDEAYELIERMYPELPKIELFARNARDGWAAWGNQAPQTASADDGLDIPGFLRRESNGGAP